MFVQPFVASDATSPAVAAPLVLPPAVPPTAPGKSFSQERLGSSRATRHERCQESRTAATLRRTSTCETASSAGDFGNQRK